MQASLQNHSDKNRDLLVPYAHARVVRETLAMTAPHQRAFLGVLAVAHVHSVPLPMLLLDLAIEVPTRYAIYLQELAGHVADGANPVQALGEIPELLPPVTVVALQFAEADGTLRNFYREYLGRCPPAEIATTFYYETFMSKYLRLVLWGWWVLVMLTFIMMRIVPEFRKMFREFEIQLPFAMSSLMYYSEFLMLFWFIPTLLLLAGILLYGVLHRQYFWRRWNPFAWRQPLTPRATQRKQVLALVANRGQSLPSALAAAGENPLLQSLFPRLGLVRVRIEGGENVWDALAAEKILSGSDAKALSISRSGDVQAWLLRRSAIVQNERQSTWGVWWKRTILVVINVFFGLLVFWICLAIFSSLLAIIYAMAEG